MKQKWLKFHTAHGPASKRFNVDTQRPNTVGDWQRSWGQITINKLPLYMVMQQQGIANADSLNEASLIQFFKEVLLKNVPAEKKELSWNYLMQAIHQGGLLNPASSSMAFLLKTAPMTLGSGNSNQLREINFTINDTGFIVQEISTAHKFFLTPRAEEIAPDLYDKYCEEMVITPDPGNEFCTKAQATVKVSFANITNEKPEPEIEVLNSHLSFGSDVIKKYADQRQWYHKFIDLLKNLLGLNSAKDLSYPDEEPSSPQP